MKVGLVLEGGAMRGMYTAGVLDTLMDEKINVDGIMGVSAGALFGVNYFSKQKGRVIRYNKKFTKDKRYMSLRSLLLTGNIVNKKFAFYDVTTKYDIFNNKTFMKTNKDYWVCVTNVKTGAPEYIKMYDILKQMEVLRATSAMPFVSRMVKLDNNKYLDGAIADSIPVKKMLSLGYDKIIVVLTRPLGYQKKSFDKYRLLLNIKYLFYPNLRKAILNRPKMYNDTVKDINELEKKGQIFVIRPTKAICLKTLNNEPEVLQNIYDLGVSDTKQFIKTLKKYLH